MSLERRAVCSRSPSLCAVAAGVALVLSGCGAPALEVPGEDPGFGQRVYAGAAMGNSRLTPDTRGTTFDVDDPDDLGTQLRLGVDVRDRLSLELDTSILGSAKLREEAVDVKYSAASLSALVYLVDGEQSHSRRQGWSAFGRVGLGVLKKSSRAAALEEGGLRPIFGAGAEYGLRNGLGIRGELTRFDDDAIYAGLGAIYRFGVTPGEAGTFIARVAAPVLAPKDRPVAGDAPTMAAARPAPDARTSSISTVVRWDPEVPVDDRDGDGLRDASDRCPDSARDLTIDSTGCGLFDAVLTDVVFGSGSHGLTPQAERALAGFAERLLAFPEARVRVLAHTDSVGRAGANLALSTHRAEAVVGYLASRGVDRAQLEARGLGETRPLASNDNVDGRRDNRRIEIETLPNRDAPPSPRVVAARSAGQGLIVAPRSRRRESVALASVSPAPVRAEPTLPESSRREPVVREPVIGAAEPVDDAVTPARKNTGRTLLPEPAVVPGLQVAGIIRDVRFASGSAELEPDADAELARIAGELAKFPDTRIAVIAHTDNRGVASQNQALSERRAAAVLERFVKHGVDRSRLEAEGYGESLPLAQNVTPADRARNRRVELRVLPR